MLTSLNNKLHNKISLRLNLNNKRHLSPKFSKHPHSRFSNLNHRLLSRHLRSHSSHNNSNRNLSLLLKQRMSPRIMLINQLMLSKRSQTRILRTRILTKTSILISRTTSNLTKTKTPIKTNKGYVMHHVLYQNYYNTITEFNNVLFFPRISMATLEETGRVDGETKMALLATNKEVATLVRVINHLVPKWVVALEDLLETNSVVLTCVDHSRMEWNPPRERLVLSFC